MQYIKLNSNKTPIEKLSNGGHPLQEVEDFENLGVLIPEPMVVFDFDSPSDAEIIQQIVEDLDIHCNMMNKTVSEFPHFYHFNRYNKQNFWRGVWRIHHEKDFRTSLEFYEEV